MASFLQTATAIAVEQPPGVPNFSLAEAGPVSASCMPLPSPVRRLAAIVPVVVLVGRRACSTRQHAARFGVVFRRLDATQPGNFIPWAVRASRRQRSAAGARCVPRAPAVRQVTIIHPLRFPGEAEIRATPRRVTQTSIPRSSPLCGVDLGEGLTDQVEPPLLNRHHLSNGEKPAVPFDGPEHRIERRIDLAALEQERRSVRGIACRSLEYRARSSCWRCACFRTLPSARKTAKLNSPSSDFKDKLLLPAITTEAHLLCARSKKSFEVRTLKRKQHRAPGRKHCSLIFVRGWQPVGAAVSILRHPARQIRRCRRVFDSNNGALDLDRSA